jgi:large subunit ribosomal protein L13
MDKIKDCTIDASGKILGRLAVEIANILRGKGKPVFLRHKDMGESVVVFNTDKIKVTGKKMTQKKYHSYSGYPGGLKSRRLEEMMERDSRKVVWSAVSGMMPKNRLSSQMMRKLKLHKGEISNN